MSLTISVDRSPTKLLKTLSGLNNAKKSNETSAFFILFNCAHYAYPLKFIYLLYSRKSMISRMMLEK